LQEFSSKKVRKNIYQKKGCLENLSSQTAFFCDTINIMKIIHIITSLLLATILFSCGNKEIDLNADASSSHENIDETIKLHYSEEFAQRNIKRVEMIYPIEYYKKAIETYQEDFYRMQRLSMKITDMMNISSITNIEHVVPKQLTFLVCWINQKGSVYYLYSFDKNQQIDEAYFCGQTVFLIPEKQILMKKLSGNILKNEVVSVGDFNRDGINEIALYTQYQNIGDAFIVHGFNPKENRMEELCLVPIFINLEKIFPSVESAANGFKILELIDDELLELAWNNYVWDVHNLKYTREIKH
jgi:hypothetical protein